MNTMLKPKKKSDNAIMETIPGHIDDSKVLDLLYSEEINWKHVHAMKTFTNFNDEVLADWMNVSVKTFREYKKPTSRFKENVKERVLSLLSLVKHGKEVFGSVANFESWLNQENFYFNHKCPVEFINTITGIKFINNRLRAMEYGDNM